MCHLESVGQVDRALRNFYDVLVPGGVLVCDERNFQYIVEHWSAIAKDPWNNFRFNSRRDLVMYHGRQVLAAPVERRRNRIIFQYADVRRDNRGRITPKVIVGDLSMLAFGMGVLRDRLKEARFEDVTVYCDLVQSTNNDLEPNADFFTYVAQKPATAARPSDVLKAAGGAAVLDRTKS